MPGATSARAVEDSVIWLRQEGCRWWCFELLRLEGRGEGWMTGVVCSAGADDDSGDEEEKVSGDLCASSVRSIVGSRNV